MRETKMSPTTPQHQTDRFTDKIQKKECSTKGCKNTVETRDSLKNKCSECVMEQIERERRLDADMNRAEMREAGIEVFN